MSGDWIEDRLRSWRDRRDAEALGELLKAFRDRAFVTAQRLTGSGADAEDAVQEAFVKLLSRTQGFEDAAAFERAVYRAVVQCALDGLRKDRRRREREAGAAAPAKDPVMSGPIVNPSSGDTREMQALLRQAVANLPEDERAPVVLCYYQGLSEQQAAETLDLTRGKIRFRLIRALGFLREFLQRHGLHAGVAALPGLLAADASDAAPETLRALLDAQLPGRPCAEVSAWPKPAQPPAAPLEAGSHALRNLLAASALAGAVLVASLALPRAAAPTQADPAPRAEAPLSPSVKVSSNPMSGPKPDPVDSKEEQPMKSKIAAVALATGLLLGAEAQAADPNPEVDAVIQQIAKHRAEKEAAAAKARAAQHEGYQGWGRGGQDNEGGLKDGGGRGRGGKR
ncbi:MAG: sigma-70 family RNA polymerase sigma factor [Planctomycetota bacterium]|nr:sigma-70 family RNA polymerase sigma factor [Planctomycetota bacterium]